MAYQPPAEIIVLVIVLSIAVFSLNMALSLWLGELLGANYYGFLVVSLFYSLVAVVLFIVRTLIKSKVNDLIITQMLN